MDTLMTVKEFKVQHALGALSVEKRYKLAEMLSTPKGILTILMNDPDAKVRSKVRNNPNFPNSLIIEEMVRQISDPHSEVRHSVGLSTYDDTSYYEFWTIRTLRKKGNDG